MAVNIKTTTAPVKIYRFGPTTEGNSSMKDVLGGKGANLAEMALIGVPVPPGFTLPCSASVAYKEFKAKPASMASFLSSLWKQVTSGIEYLEEANGSLPLVSVRSGARVSMPGMMDTILNVGLTSGTIDKWASLLGDKAAYDSYRRLIQMYSSVAMGVPSSKFEAILTSIKEESSVKSDAELSADQLRRVVTRYLKMLEESSVEFPDTFEDQLKGAVLAVFNSWNNPRAIEYRKINSIPEEWGTAVNVQTMVFGNLNEESATGVLFTRDPSSGENQIVGEFLVNAQGEDVVSGVRTPLPLSAMLDWNSPLLDELVTCVSMLEEHYRDMQDVEFTIQSGKLYMLQTRNAKRSAQAAFKIAYDLVQEGLITSEDAVGRVTQAQLLAVTQSTIDPKFNKAPDLVGIAAGGGLATGVAVFSSDDAVNCTEPCILVTPETDPDDIAGMNAAVGILTATGGMTSHAAVVARGMNKSCVVGATDLTVEAGYAHTPTSITVNKFTKVTIDGSTGNVWFGITVPVIPGGSSMEVKALIGWAMNKEGGVSDRIEINHSMDQAQILSEITGSVCNSIYIDTALIEGVGTFKSLPMVTTALHNIGTYLLDSKASEVIIDLTSLDDHLSKGDQVFNFIFGYGPDTDSCIILSKVDGMLKWPSEVKAKAVVKIPNGNHTQATKVLKDAGFKVMGYVSTVADILSASGPIQISQDTMLKVFGSAEAYAQICSMVESSTGKSLSGAVPSPVYWYDFLNKGGV